MNIAHKHLNRKMNKRTSQIDLQRFIRQPFPLYLKECTNMRQKSSSDKWKILKMWLDGGSYRKINEETGESIDKLILFDIDHTLINGAEGHRLAFHEGFRIVYGVETTIDIIDYLGMTDKEIIYEVLKIHGFDEKIIASKLQECMDIMVDVFNRVASNYLIKVLGGVKELLNELNTHHVLVGLATGNIEPIAWKKMQIVRLDSYFSLGGFGSDDRKRSNIIRLAIKRAEEKFNFKFNNNVYIFGDTPRDIYAGKEAHIKTIGVATGRFTEEQLIKAGADFVFQDLKDTARVLKVVLN